MAEIKSTLDLVMEKTKHLTLSREEKEEHQRMETRRKVYGLVQKYQDNIFNKERLKIEIDSLEITYRLKVYEILADILIDGLKLREKNESLLELLHGFCGIDVSDLETVFNDFLHRKGVMAKERVEAIKEDLAKARSISGSAVVPNLEADSMWLSMLGQIEQTFDDILNREKAAAKAKYMRTKPGLTD